jgi:GNAT superfamily N-acetyltransferase
LLAWAVIEAARSHRPRGFWDLWVPDAEARLAFVEQLLVEAIARATPFFGCMHETPPGAWLVESVATRPEARGQGLDAALDAAIGCPGVAQMSCPL